MRLLALPLRRPVATGAIYGAVLLLALFALPGLPLSLAPDAELPRLSIQLRWQNASPEAMEALVTAKIEAEIQRLRGVEEVFSTSGRGWAQIDVSFARETRMDRAEVFVRERLATLRELLPPDLAAPEISSYQSEQESGGQFFAARAFGPRTAESLRSVLDEVAAPRLAAIPGVSSVGVYGGGRRELRIDVDPDAVSRGLVSLAEITNAIADIGDPEGIGASKDGEYRLSHVLSRPEASALSAAAAIASTSDAPRVRVGEVAAVRASWGEPRRIARVNGEPAVQIVLEREPGSNVIQVACAVRAELLELEGRLPEEIELQVLADQSERISAELGALGRRSLFSILALFCVIGLAQRSWRPPVVVVGSVLFATLITALLFRAAGLGMNLVTLSGLALALGMAVDGSIVVWQAVEHRVRRRRPDVPHTVAALRSVLLPLFAGTLTTAVVMVPFLYLTGDLRTYYLPFVFAIGLSLCAAFTVAVTLTPLCSVWSLSLERSSSETTTRSPLTSLLASATLAARHAYSTWLTLSLRHPIPVVLTALLLLAGSIWIFQEKVSRGALFPGDPETGLRVSVSFPEGTDLARTEATVSDFETLVLESSYYRRGWIDQVQLGAMEGRGWLQVRLHPAVAQSEAPAAIKEELTIRAASISGAEVSVSGYGPGFSSGNSASSPSYQLTLEGPDYLELGRLAEAIGGRLAREPKVREIDTNASSWFVDDATEQVVRIDRGALDRLGLSMRELLQVVEPAVAGDLSRRELRDRDGEFDALVRFAGGDAPTIQDLEGRTMQSDAGVTFPLSEVLRVEERPIPAEIRRHDQEYTRAITFDFRGPTRVGNRFLRSFLAGTELPPGYTMRDGLGLFLTGRERGELGLALGVALALIYMVTAALFESLVLPFVAIVAVPLGFTLVPLAFWASGESFDRTAYIGLILLSGIAINSALLLVHRAGALRRRGIPMRDAARLAAMERARPIMLTTTTSVVGLLPLALGTDATAAEGWRALALASSSGLAAAAAASLLVVPALLVLCAGGKAPVHSLSTQPLIRR